MNLNSTEKKQIRIFGLIAFLFFGLLCGLGIWKGKTLPVYAFGALSVLGIGFIVAPIALKPVYSAWLRVAHIIGGIITKSILILIFYLVITPAALIKGAIGGRPLQQKPDRKSSSYWVPRTEPAQPRDRFLKRY